MNTWTQRFNRGCECDRWRYCEMCLLFASTADGRNVFKSYTRRKNHRREKKLKNICWRFSPWTCRAIAGSHIFLARERFIRVTGYYKTVRGVYTSCTFRGSWRAKFRTKTCTRIRGNNNNNNDIITIDILNTNDSGRFNSGPACTCCTIVACRLVSRPCTYYVETDERVYNVSIS